MFYVTRIQTINGSTVTDTSGRRLRFIGNLPVKVGDVVCTDGTFIFGHAPPKGSPAIFDEQSGIPILANNLRGYFNLNGDFKSYNIAGDAWIVNDKKFYAHDVDDVEIIDAEIANDGELFTVVKNVTQLEGNDEDFYYRYYHEKQAVGFKNPEWLAYSMLNYSGFHTSGHYSKRLYNFSISSSYADFMKHDDSILKSCEIIIFKDTSKIASINFNTAIELAEKIAQEYTYLNSVAENPSLAYFCKKSRAILYNFKILPSGNYTYLLRVETWAERYQLVALSNPYVNGSIPVLVNFLFKVTTNTKNDTDTQILGKTVKHFPFLFHYEIADFPSKDKESYEFISPPNFPYTDFIYASAFGNPYYYFLFKVWDSEMLPNANEYKNGFNEFSDDFSFPIQDNYYAKLINRDSDIDFWTIEGIYDSDNQKVFNFDLAPNPLTWNMCFFPLKGNKFLFGIHNGYWYIINDEGLIEFIGSNLKNFRFRELKRISKAKK